jgi:hypothetical protein
MKEFQNNLIKEAGLIGTIIKPLVTPWFGKARATHLATKATNVIHHRQSGQLQTLLESKIDSRGRPLTEKVKNRLLDRSALLRESLEKSDKKLSTKGMLKSRLWGASFPAAVGAATIVGPMAGAEAVKQRQAAQQGFVTGQDPYKGNFRGSMVTGISGMATIPYDLMRGGGA